MLTRQMLQQMLMDSEIAQQYFLDAQHGLFLNNSFHDLFYDVEHDRISSKSYDTEPTHDSKQQLIYRIHGDEPTQYIWPDINWKLFVSFCLQEFERSIFHELPNEPLQQQKELERHKGLHRDELEL